MTTQDPTSMPGLSPSTFDLPHLASCPCHKMTEFRSVHPSFDTKPFESITLPQFLLDNIDTQVRNHDRPARPVDSKWLVENETGKSYTLPVIKERVHGLANALAGRLGVRDNDVGSSFL